jgi:hypothetical protein
MLKDSGFSPVTLAWVLKDMPVRSLGLAAQADEADIAARIGFRDRLMATLVALSRPTESRE